MTIEEIKQRVQYGDYTTLGKVLETTSDAAKKRLLRGDQKAREAMIKIIESRENLIKEFQTN